VAEALGCTGEAYWVQTEEPVSAYLPLEEHFYGFPDRDAALLWNPEHGWSAVVDEPEPLVIAYLDALLPEPAAVATFVADLVAGRGAGRPEPPSFRCPSDVLRTELAAQAPRLALTG
jgi:hypothetical protein